MAAICGTRLARLALCADVRLPLVGWSMLSAGGYPVVLYGPLQLPPIVPQNPKLFATLRSTHTLLALVLFATFLAHLAAALMHGLIFRDEVFPSMSFWRFSSAASGVRLGSSAEEGKR